jgi:hypothetical protein
MWVRSLPISSIADFKTEGSYLMVKSRCRFSTFQRKILSQSFARNAQTRLTKGNVGVLNDFLIWANGDFSEITEGKPVIQGAAIVSKGKCPSCSNTPQKGNPHPI